MRALRSATTIVDGSSYFASDVRLRNLLQKTEAEMLRTPNFGRKSFNEITEVLAQMGLHLRMEVFGWPPGNGEEHFR